MPETPLDILADELGAFAGRIEKEANLRLAAAESNIARREAELDRRAVELDAQFAALQRSISDAIANIKNGLDGKDGIDGKDGRDGIDGTNGKDGIDGRDGTNGQDGIAGRDGVDGLHGKDGLDGAIGLTGAAGEPGEKGMDGATGERGAPGEPGKLPMVKAWSDTIHYEGEVVTHDGAAYQSRRDTGRAPPHEDWICIAKAGRDGAEGRSFTVCGTYSADEQYDALSVVALNGGAFVAKRDDPGPCPGDGWQLMASQGKQGKPGERGVGQKGDRGNDGPPIINMSVDDEGLLTLTNSDGTEIVCDLYPLLTKLVR